jgi:pathogenesis-related protein 1
VDKGIIMKVKHIAVLGLTLSLIGCGSNDLKEFVDDSKDFIANGADSIVDVQEDINMTDEIRTILTMHNETRAEVGVNKELIWSDLIAKDAQNYADILAKSGAFEHDPKNHEGYENGQYGENLYASTATLTKDGIAKGVQAWIDEKAFYHYGRVGDETTCDVGEQCGHYTQIIWENTSKVGCATSIYKRGDFKDGYVLVCKYQTPGNYIGETPY